MKDMECKVVVIGDSGVGKTSLVDRYIHDTFDDNVNATPGASFSTRKVELGGYRIKMQIWDTAGQERFKALTAMYYRECDAVLLVCSVVNKDSLKSIKEWYNDVMANAEPSVLVVVGSKVDQKDRTVLEKDLRDMADSIGVALIHETSAKDRTGIASLFEKVCGALVSEYDQARPARKGPGGDTIQVKSPPQSSQSCCS